MLDQTASAIAEGGGPSGPPCTHLIHQGHHLAPVIQALVGADVGNGGADHVPHAGHGLAGNRGGGSGGGLSGLQVTLLAGGVQQLLALLLERTEARQLLRRA